MDKKAEEVLESWGFSVERDAANVIHIWSINGLNAVTFADEQCRVAWIKEGHVKLLVGNLSILLFKNGNFVVDLIGVQEDMEDTLSFAQCVATALLKAKEAFYDYLEENGWDPDVAIEITAKTISRDGTYVVEIMKYDNTESCVAYKKGE